MSVRENGLLGTVEEPIGHGRVRVTRYFAPEDEINGIPHESGITGRLEKKTVSYYLQKGSRIESPFPPVGGVTVIESNGSEGE